MRKTKEQRTNTDKPVNLSTRGGPLADGWHEVTQRVGEPWALPDEPLKEVGSRREVDIERRTATFGEEIVRFARCVPRNPVNDRLANQLVGAGTSVGALVCEARD